MVLPDRLINHVNIGYNRVRYYYAGLPADVCKSIVQSDALPSTTTRNACTFAGVPRTYSVKPTEICQTGPSDRHATRPWTLSVSSVRRSLHQAQPAAALCLTPDSVAWYEYPPS